uniref:ORF1 protein n=2 Tax=Panagrellus redivivus TaxID=6233 RepID=Q26105_PANRE|nr:ORF1 [Panagrellus redivivus]
MEKISEVFEKLPKEVSAAIQELSPDAIREVIGGLVDPERAQAYLKAESEKLKQAAKEAAETELCGREQGECPEPRTSIRIGTGKEPDAAAENRELVAKCAAMMAMMTKAAAEKETPRTWSTKAYEYQHVFNASVKALIQAKEFDKAVVKLDARNADLALADKQPGILATLDTAKSYAQGSGESMSNALVSFLLIQAVNDRDTCSSQRSLPTRQGVWTGDRSKQRGGYKRYGQQPSSSTAPPAKSFRCFKCGRNGHYASSCHAKTT